MELDEFEPPQSNDEAEFASELMAEAPEPEPERHIVYNPDNWHIVGHHWAAEQVSQAMNAGRFRHAYLISGPPEIGKTTFALRMAMALNCEADNRPCGECRPCKMIAARKHFDLHMVEAERIGGTLKIDQIRELQSQISLRPYEARYRVIILRRFQEAHPAAANALLKTLEEPPQNVVLILITDNLHALLPTILSRCQQIPLHHLRLEDVQHTLETHYQMPTADAELLAHLSGGRVGWAIKVMEDNAVFDRRREFLDRLEKIIVSNRRERFGLLEGLEKDKSQVLEILQLWQLYWRDALLLAAHCPPQWITNADRREALATWVKQKPVTAFQKAVQVTRQTLNYLDHNVNTRLALEAMVLDYPFLTAKK